MGLVISGGGGSSGAKTAVNSTRAASDNNLKAWTGDPALISSTLTPTAGVVYLTELPVRDAQTISKIWWNSVQSLAAGGGSAANTFFGVYALLAAGTLTLIGKTADQTAAMSGVSAGVYSATLTVEASQSLALDGTKRLWGAHLIGTQGSTTFQITRATSSASLANMGQTAGTDNLRAAKSGTAQSALPATIAVSGLTVDFAALFGVS